MQCRVHTKNARAPHQLFSYLCLQAIVRIPYWHRHTKLDVDTRRNSKIWAHDEYQLCNVGDMVRAARRMLLCMCVCSVPGP